MEKDFNGRMQEGKCNGKYNGFVRRAEKELTEHVDLMKRSPLARWGRVFLYKMNFACAIARAEFRKVWTGREYVVFISDEYSRFYVFSENEMSGILRYAKKRLFMRRPEMRRRIVYRTAC